MRVIGNLVSNACKFTQKGGKVSVSAAELGGDLHLWVSDNGKGMEPAETRKIFDRFGRLKQHSQVAGTGLGLFIVKSLVAAHGGQIEVTSAVDVGTTFELIFPKTPPMNEHGELLSLDFG